MRWYCIRNRMKFFLKSHILELISTNCFKKICFVSVFLITSISRYLLGMFEYHSYNPEHKLVSSVIEYFIWSIESGDWFRYSLISLTFGVVSVYLLKWVMINWKYWKNYWGCE